MKRQYTRNSEGKQYRFFSYLFNRNKYRKGEEQYQEYLENTSTIVLNKIISFVTSLSVPHCRYLAWELYFTAFVYSSFCQSCSSSHTGSLDSAEGQVIITGNEYGGLL